jgi:hypothetical protein
MVRQFAAAIENRKYRSESSHLCKRGGAAICSMMGKQREVKRYLAVTGKKDGLAAGSLRWVGDTLSSSSRWRSR